MPGIPPDALEQAKRGFRGLFSRKKHTQADPATATATTKPGPTATAPPAPEPARESGPKDVQKDLPGTKAEETEAEPAAPAPGAAPTPTAPATTTAPTTTTEGMSATSGPLSDAFEAEEGRDNVEPESEAPGEGTTA